MNVIPFEASHIARMDIQPGQRVLISHLPLAYIEQLPKAGPALTAEDQGRILACAGIAHQGYGVGILWACVASGTHSYFIRLDRCVRRFLEIPRLRRIEATTDFEPGCRWLELLGFEFEGVKKKYGPDGKDHRAYARVW